MMEGDINDADKEEKGNGLHPPRTAETPESIVMKVFLVTIDGRKVIGAVTG